MLWSFIATAIILFFLVLSLIESFFNENDYIDSCSVVSIYMLWKHSKYIRFSSTSVK